MYQFRHPPDLHVTKWKPTFRVKQKCVCLTSEDPYMQPPPSQTDARHDGFIALIPPPMPFCAQSPLPLAHEETSIHVNYAWTKLVMTITEPGMFRGGRLSLPPPIVFRCHD